MIGLELTRFRFPLRGHGPPRLAVFLTADPGHSPSRQDFCAGFTGGVRVALIRAPRQQCAQPAAIGIPGTRMSLFSLACCSK